MSDRWNDEEGREDTAEEGEGRCLYSVPSVDDTTMEVVGIKEGTSGEASNSGGVYSTGADGMQQHQKIGCRLDMSPMGDPCLLPLESQTSNGLI